MNSITIAGQLGRDAELKFLPNGDPILNFSVADSQGGKDRPTLWWACAIFGKRAESLAPYLLKGQTVTVSGALTKREWEKDGVKREALDLRVADLALQGGKPNDNQGSSKPLSSARPVPKQTSDEFIDDCPF